MKSLNISEPYSGPPSFKMSSGIPKVANNEWRALRRPFVLDEDGPGLAEESVG